MYPNQVLCIELMVVMIDGSNTTLSSSFVPIDVAASATFKGFAKWDDFVDAFEADGLDQTAGACVDSTRVDDALEELRNRCTVLRRSEQVPDAGNYDLPVPEGWAIVRRHVRQLLVWV